MDPASLENVLCKRDLGAVLTMCSTCVACSSEEDFDALLTRVAALLGFEFLLYAHQMTSYQRPKPVKLVNISNPKPWMDEYNKRNYVENDPVRLELEVRLADNEETGVIHWDAYERELSVPELEIISRRRHYGLEYGFSAYCNSSKHDSVFLVSFASAGRRPDRRAKLMAGFLVKHLGRARKYLDLFSLVSTLTPGEQRIAQWLVEGKSNWEIAKITGVSDSTVKYHVANILKKTGSNSRQRAVAILIAERYLS